MTHEASKMGKLFADSYLFQNRNSSSLDDYLSTVEFFWEGTLIMIANSIVFRLFLRIEGV